MFSGSLIEGNPRNGMEQNTSPTTSCIFLATAKSEDTRDLEAVRWVHMDPYAYESTSHVSVT
jgi:hypothetical protein